MSFNRDVLKRVNVWPPRRSTILVGDTGVGFALFEDPAFQKLLATNVSERLGVMYPKDPFSGLDKLDQPSDEDRNFFDNDVFGYSGSLVSEVASLFGAASSSRFPGVEHILAFARDERAQDSYEPAHGSHVAGLAAGGPDFIEAFPDIGYFVGLKFYRLPLLNGANPNSSVTYSQNDIKRLFDFGKASNSDVINFSMFYKKENPFLNMEYQGLVVTSAGNRKGDLRSEERFSFPAALDRSILPLGNQLIVVAALDDEDKLASFSNFSPVHADIAAPGVRLSSYDLSGDRICMSGTSQASPLVTFTLSLLRALGLPDSRALKKRLFKAADFVPALEDKIVKGRRLNIATTVDLFVDQVWTRGAEEPLRGFLSSNLPSGHVVLCPDPGDEKLSSTRGFSLMDHLQTIHRVSDDEFNFVVKGISSEAYEESVCAPANTVLRFRDLSGERHTLVLSELDRVVTTAYPSQRVFLQRELLSGS